MEKKIKKVRKSKIEKPFADGTMSRAAFFAMIRAALRNKSRWFKSISICRERAKVPYIGINKKRKWLYRCEECHELFDIKSTSVHHQHECGNLNSFDDLPGFVQRLFCNSNKLILICNNCHNKHHPKKSKKDDSIKR